MPGPVPKRSKQRRRRNKAWIEKANATPVSRPVEPPRNGKGATSAAWREYARQLGYPVSETAGRSEIIVMVDAGGPDGPEAWHPLARDWFHSLSESGQSAFYGPSDWQTARILAELLSRVLKMAKPSAALIERWQVGATELLTTEGARRRLRLELEQSVAPVIDPEEESAVADLAAYRQRASS